MKIIPLCFFLIFANCIIVFGAGTDTFSSLQTKDVSKNYLNIDNITVTKIYEDSMGIPKERLCLNVNDPVGGKEYKLTDEKEIILVLLSIIIDLNSQIKSK